MTIDTATASGAKFSPCRRYRYALWRRWGPGKLIAFIGLNPSTADERDDDPTIRRCLGFTRAWGGEALVMLNLFAWRATFPADLKRAAHPIGDDNDAAIVALAGAADTVVAAWGVDGAWRHRGFVVAAKLRAAGVPLLCLGRTKAGQPRHPLYLPADAAPEPYGAKKS
jgi:hypothetical protein